MWGDLWASHCLTDRCPLEDTVFIVERARNVTTQGFRQDLVCNLLICWSFILCKTCSHLTCLTRSLNSTCNCQRGKGQLWLSEKGKSVGQEDGEWVGKGPGCSYTGMLMCCRAMIQLCWQQSGYFQTAPRVHFHCSKHKETMSV